MYLPSRPDHVCLSIAVMNAYCLVVVMSGTVLTSYEVLPPILWAVVKDKLAYPHGYHVCFNEKRFHVKVISFGLALFVGIN